MTKPRILVNQVTLASLIIAIMLVVGFVLNNYLATTALRQNDLRWCATLELLTSHPVPKPADPAANPSRENAYLFYSHLKDLERQFGC
jgi:hypothetical protein